MTHKAYTFFKALKMTLLFMSFFLFPVLLCASDDIVFSVDIQAARGQEDSSILSVSITNQSSETLYLLTWNTPLENTLNADVFDVRYDNQNIIYTGRVVKRNAPADSDFTLLQAGESIYTSLNLYDYYKMDKEGSYQITYKGQLVYRNAYLPKGSVSQDLKRTNGITQGIEIDFSPLIEWDINQKLPADFTGCSTTQTATLKNAHDAAIVMAKTAADAMNRAVPPTSAERYVIWFGTPDGNRHNTVKTHFNNILNALDSQQVVFDCTCTENWYAWVYSDQPYEIHICNEFWWTTLTGTDSQAGTLIHETSHFTIVAGTDDHAYGQYDAKLLAINDPDIAIDNADSHEYFAENTPFLEFPLPVNITPVINYLLN